MNTSMTGFRWLSETLHSCALDERSFSIRRVKTMNQLCLAFCTNRLKGKRITNPFLFYPRLQRVPIYLCKWYSADNKNKIIMKLLNSIMFHLIRWALSRLSHKGKRITNLYFVLPNTPKSSHLSMQMVFSWQQWWSYEIIIKLFNSILLHSRGWALCRNEVSVYLVVLRITKPF